MNIDNPQGTPTEAEIAWLAGILEGEGTVMLAAWVRNEKFEFTERKLAPGTMKIGVSLKFYNTDAGIMTKVIDVLDKLEMPYHVREREMKPMAKVGGGEYKPSDPMITVTINKLSVAYRLAKVLYPWCFGNKKLRLAMIIQYLARRFKKAEERGTSRTEYDIDDIKIVNEFYSSCVKRPDNNSKLVERLLNEYERSAA